jgi:hypothetical protein
MFATAGGTMIMFNVRRTFHEASRKLMAGLAGELVMKKSSSAIAVAALALTLSGGNANAATFTYNFTGTITATPAPSSIPGLTINIGDPWSASVFINTESPLITGSSQYRFLGSDSITVGGNTYASGSDNLHITVDPYGGGWQATNSGQTGNQLPPVVTPTVNGSLIGTNDQLAIVVTANATYPGPPTLPEFSATDTFTNVGIGLRYDIYVPQLGGYQGFSVYGSGNLAAISQVPTPGSLPLVASVLGTMGFLGWRKKRKDAAAVAAEG